MIDPASKPKDTNGVRHETLDLSDPATVIWIDSTATLLHASRGWLRREVLAIDTEFVRERTFYPRLGLIQVSDGQQVYLVDPLAIEDLEPLGRVLTHPKVLKVFHSGSEDLEVLYHRFGDFPRPIFDTQVAATVLGIGYNIGYAKLVDLLFDSEIEKGQTRTNWLQRPLTPAQERYAAQDVTHLIPAYQRLHRDLVSRDRDDWAREETARLFDTERFLPDPERFYLRLKQTRNMTRLELAALKGLCSWREREARRRDLPRNFILAEATLIGLARARPRTPRELGRVRELQSRDRDQYGRPLLALLNKTSGMKPGARPPKLERPLNLAPHKSELDQLRRIVASRAEELGVAPELLATKRAVVALLGRVLRAQTPVLPEALRGWRQEAIGHRLVDQLKRRIRPEPS